MLTIIYYSWNLYNVINFAYRCYNLFYDNQEYLNQLKIINTLFSYKII